MSKKVIKPIVLIVVFIAALITLHNYKQGK